MRLFLLTALLLFCLTPLAHAACTNPDGEEAVIIYNTTSKNLQFCNGAAWVSMGGGVGLVGPGSTMVSGWPDVISCTVSGVNVYLYMDGVGASIYYRRLGSDYAEAVYGIFFSPAGAYQGNENMAGSDCATGTMSINALYLAGKAFNLAGAGGAGGGGSNETIIDSWPDALLCTDNGGTPAPTGRQSLFILNYRDPSAGAVHYAWLGSGPNFWGYSYNADGSYANTYSNPAVLDTTDCVNKSITQLYADGQAFDLAGIGPVSDTLSSLTCSNGQFAKWDGTAWVCGTVTGGGGGGSDTLAALSCTSGQIAKWNGTAWACATDASGSTPTCTHRTATSTNTSLSNHVSVSCNAGETMTGGGCDGGIWPYRLYRSSPSNATTWGCDSHGYPSSAQSNTVTAYAVCCQW